MQLFKFDPATGQRGDFIKMIERASWTARYLKADDIHGALPTPAGFGHSADVGIHIDGGRGLIGDEISYIDPEQWVCFCLGAFIINDADQWQWVILPPAKELS